MVEVFKGIRCGTIMQARVSGLRSFSLRSRMAVAWVRHGPQAEHIEESTDLESVVESKYAILTINTMVSFIQNQIHQSGNIL